MTADRDVTQLQFVQDDTHFTGVGMEVNNVVTFFRNYLMI
jgi:hypothetical protein